MYTILVFLTCNTKFKCVMTMHTHGVLILVLKNKMYNNRISVDILLYVEHQWKLGNNIIENVFSMYVLGVAFNNNFKNSTPVNERIQK